MPGIAEGYSPIQDTCNKNPGMMKRTYFLSLLTLAFSLTIPSFARDKDKGYRIAVKISHLSEQAVYLGYHFADKNYVEDTLQLDSKGRGVFTGDSLPGGVYLLVMPNMRFIEFLVDENNQRFTIEADTTDFFKTLKFIGSEDNMDFLHFQEQLYRLNMKLRDLHQRESKNKNNADSIAVLQKQINAVNQQTKELNRKIIQSHKGTFLAHLVQAMTPPDVPDFNLPEDTPARDSLLWVKRYNWLRDHYFDGVHFGDERLLRTPVLQSRLNQYFNRILIQRPDSLIPQIDKIIARAEKNNKVYQYVVIYLMNNFQKSTIMGLDEVYVHIAERYYLSGKTPWSDSTFLAGLKDRIEHIKPNLIGRKAPDLRMETLGGEWVDLWELKSPYTILFFWEPNCGFCKKTIPELWSLYQQYKHKGLTVMAIYIYDKKDEWKKFIEEHNYMDDHWINAWDPHQLTNFRVYYDVYSTPVIYVLDKDKYIVAKRLDVEILKRFLEGNIK